MNIDLWWAATPGAAFVAGVLALVILLVRGKHKEGKDVIPQRITSAALLGFSLYSLLLFAVCHFFNLANITTVMLKVGDDRVAILFTGLAADVFARLWRTWA